MKESQQSTNSFLSHPGLDPGYGFAKNDLMREETKDGVPTFHAKSRKDWRNWLIENHDREKSVWLIIYHKDSSTPSVSYPEAVDESLCFGWIDSKPNKGTAKVLSVLSKRNPKSNWSGVNKRKIEHLLEAGLIAEPRVRNDSNC